MDGLQIDASSGVKATGFSIKAGRGAISQGDQAKNSILFILFSK